MERAQHPGAPARDRDRICARRLATGSFEPRLFSRRSISPPTRLTGMEAPAALDPSGQRNRFIAVEFIRSREETGPDRSARRGGCCAPHCGRGRRAGPKQIRVAVNLVRRLQFRSRGLVAMVTHALARQRACGSPRLELEITEAVLLQDDEGDPHHAAPDAGALGVRISMDDFGTGYSSLSYLRQLFRSKRSRSDRSFISRYRSPIATTWRSSRPWPGSVPASASRPTAEASRPTRQLELVAQRRLHRGPGLFIRPARISAAGGLRSHRNFRRETRVAA